MILYLALAFLLFLLALIPLLGAGDFRYQWVMASGLTLIAYTASFLRWETGTDWDMYASTFSSLRDMAAVQQQSWWGPGYSYVAVLVNSCGGGYSIFLFCIATLLFSVKFHLLRVTCAAPLIAIFALFCLDFYDIYFVRQNMAVIFFWAFAYYEFNRKPAHALCAALLAIAFHYAAALPVALVLPIGRVTPKTASLCGVPALLLIALAISNLSITDILSIPGVQGYLVSSFVEEKATEVSTTARAYMKLAFWVFLLGAGYYAYYKGNLSGAGRRWNLYCLHASSVIVGISAALLPLSEIFARFPAFAAPLLASVLANYRFPALPMRVGGAAYVTVLLLLFVELAFQYSAYPDLFYPVKTVFD
jgi:hypothetical protein